jgi:HK97 family phage major capsid protein
MSPQLKQYLVANHGLAADADDAAAKSLLGELVATGQISLDKVKELSVARSDVEQRVQGMIDASVAKHFDAFKTELKGMLTPAPAQPQGTPAPAADPTLQGPSQSKAAYLASTSTDPGTSEANPAIRVKSVVEQFDDTRTAATYDKSQNEFLRKHFVGRRVNIGEGIGMPTRDLDMPTERSKAIAGAWFKRLIGKAYRETGRPIPQQFRLTELDQKLVGYAIHECKFVGPVHFDNVSEESVEWYKGVRATELQRKALLDDVTSGGLEAVPIEFDDAVIITPLLEGELFPIVTIRNVTRRRIEGFSIGNPTMAWGVAEGSAIALFTTTAFIAAFDTTIYPVAGAMEIGLDFLADSPVDIGAIIIERYGSRFRSELDMVIAVGSDGSSQPEGVFSASGTRALNAANGSTGPWTLADVESLLFGVGKQYRAEAGKARAIFLSNETTYSRWRGMALGTADARRLLGNDYQSYMTLEHPHKLNNSIGNRSAGFFCMNRYRFYRRAGFQVRIVTEDQTLARANEEMIVVRSRVGGKLELGGAGAKIADGQS